jgi:hypothetical protein
MIMERAVSNTGCVKNTSLFLNLKTGVPIMSCFLSDRHHVQWCLDVSLAGPLVSAIRTTAVELPIRTESGTAVQLSFHQKILRRDAPSSSTVLLWVSKWRQEGSVKDIKPQGLPQERARARCTAVISVTVALKPKKRVNITDEIIYTGCFTTCGHYCKRRFLRSLWSKTFI